jgi:hypothetical protein
VFACSVVAIAIVSLAVGSYVQKLREPGSDTLTERSAEWLRDNHLGTLVNWGEDLSYRLNPPVEGGQPPPITVPAPDQTPATTSSAPPTSVKGVDHLPAPAALSSPASDAVAGEGQWAPIGPSVAGTPALYMTQLRPDAVHTSYLDLVVWMDPKLLRFEQHPGVEVPGGTYAAPSSIPAAETAQLAAAFNGGFRMQDAQGGYYQDGVGASTLVAGAATLAISTDGTANVGEWGRDLSLAPTIASARQNLALIVDGGAPVAGLDDNAAGRWGATVGNKVFVWRSGIGVTADGALVYVGGPSLSAKTLAETLARAGAVRAMELDINHDWVTFNTYRASSGGAVSGTKLLGDMARPADRYLTTDSRDFIAVLLRPR